MARRAPKNPLNDIINTAGAWLGGNRGTVNPQVQSAMQGIRGAAGAADAATGGFGSALLSDAQRMAQTGSSTPSALYKTAAVNLAAAAAGAAAAKVAGKVVSNVVESGVPARVANRLTGQSVVVHGSSVGGLKRIEPRAGSAALPYDKAAFAWNPAAYKSKDGMSSLLWDTRSYTSKSLPDVDELRKGTVYVAKTPTKNLKKIKEASPTPGPLVDMSRVQSFKESGMYTDKSLKVVNSVDVSRYRDSAERAIELAKKIKSAGGKVPKGATKRRSYVVEDDF